MNDLSYIHIYKDETRTNVYADLINTPHAHIHQQGQSNEYIVFYCISEELAHKLSEK